MVPSGSLQPTEAADLAAEAATRKILDRRARELAAAVTDYTLRRPLFEVLVFSIGGTDYGLESGFVRRVVPFVDFTPLPGGPAWLLGVTSLRGIILPVFDLHRVVSSKRKGIKDLKWLVTVGTTSMEFGVVAEQVKELRAIYEEDLSQVGNADSSLSRFITGDGTAIIDGMRLLEDDRFFVRIDAQSVPPGR